MPAPQRRYTEAEYLALDAAAPEGVKYEYTNGLLTPMNGADPNHELIVANLLAHLHPLTLDGRCRVYGSNLRVKVRASRSYKYPDVSGRCGPAEFEDTHPRTFLNPSVLIEVLSPSTERDDRTHKFEHYKLIPSLAEYVLIAQRHMQVERHVRAGASWVLDTFTHPDDVLALPSINAALRLAAIYRNVELSDPPVWAPRIVREEEAPAWGATV